MLKYLAPRRSASYEFGSSWIIALDLWFVLDLFAHHVPQMLDQIGIWEI